MTKPSRTSVRTLPPAWASSSRTVTVQPACCSRNAADKPDGPPPTTMTEGPDPVVGAFISCARFLRGGPVRGGKDAVRDDLGVLRAGGDPSRRPQARAVADVPQPRHRALRLDRAAGQGTGTGPGAAGDVDAEDAGPIEARELLPQVLQDQRGLGLLVEPSDGRLCNRRAPVEVPAFRSASAHPGAAVP